MDSVISPGYSEKPATGRNWLRVGIFSVVVLLVGAVVGSALTVKGWSPFNGSSNNPPLVLPENQPRVNQAITLTTGFSAVAKAVTPAVVVIRTQSRMQQQQNPFFNNPFEDLFPDDDEGGPQPRRRVPTPNTPKGKEKKGQLVPSGVGSGVIVTQDGYILTNNHVVDGAEKVEVELADKRIFKANVIGTDPPSDIAVIKLDATGLPTVPLGDSTQAEVGDIVLAVGNPLGVGQTVTMGIISAKGRSTTSGVGRQSYEDFLQTDAPINRGNSGGALVNLKGELVGIPSQILSPSGGSIGIGFAIPTNMARKVMEQLIAGGKVKRGMLGVIIGQMDTELAEQFGYKGAGGVLVQEVSPGLAAEKAGLKHGDIITEFEGHRIVDSNEFRNLVANIPPGSSVKLKIWRDGSEREVTAKLVDAEAQTTLASSESGNSDKGETSVTEGVLSGVKVENITPELSQRLNMNPGMKGVVVTSVDEDSAAAGALRRGDVIVEVNRQAVSSAAEFNAAAKKAGNKKALLYVQQQRGGSTRGGFVTITPQE
ncbi:MAG: Do family serine endopeptidase [Acidobacteria bacterium]|nr:Do family serine endopeptidase [Acidobacteriota bacterium]